VTLILLIIGILAGILSGLLGIGGGTLFTPVLFYLFDRHGVANPELWTIGTSLFCTFAASSGGTIKHIRQRSAFVKESLYVGAFGIIGTTVGKLIATSEWFSTSEFLLLIGVVFIYTGINFVSKSITEKGRTDLDYADKTVRKRDAGVIGGAGGFIAALSGLGGGVLMVPIMNMGFKYTLRKAVSISEFAIVLISLAGFMQFLLRSPLLDTEVVNYVTFSQYTVGYVDFGASLPLVIGAFLGAGLGVQLHDKLNTRYIKRIFGILVLIVAVRMLWELF
jgi:uncharacterized membrane protein YfcA